MKFSYYLNELNYFVIHNNKIPSKRSKNTYEAKLGYWCCRKRYMYKKNILNRHQMDKLNQIPNWYWSYRESKYFDIMFNKVKIFIETNKRIPTKWSDNCDEKKLGSWCSYIRRIKNKISDDKKKLFDNIQGWTWEFKQTDISLNIKKLKDFIILNKRLPSIQTNDESEHDLAMWYIGQKEKEEFDQISNFALKKIRRIKSFYEETTGKKYDEDHLLN